MKVGSICYATSRGLGHLCRDFHRHGVVTDVMVVVHPGVPTNEDWYPNAPRTMLKRPDVQAMCDFCDGHDAMLFFETPFAWDVIRYCSAKGIKTAVVTMYECTPRELPAAWVPDLWLCPSLLDMEYFGPGQSKVEVGQQWVRGDGGHSVFLPLPVEYPWRLREVARRFVHNGGYLGVRGREGTREVIEAWRHVKSPAELLVRVQENVEPNYIEMCKADSRITYSPETVLYHELYATGDVAIGAQKWNGCSLPLQEACASGMLVMNTDRFPMNTWLPKEPLIPVDHYATGRIASRFFDFQEAVVDPRTIAATVDAWYNRDIAEFSRRGKEWAEANSWGVLKPKYLEALS